MPNLYGISISIAISLCLVVALKIFPSGKNRSDTNKVWDLGLYSVFGGILGARIYHVIDYWYYYSIHPVQIFEVWKGGLGIWGAILGGMVGVWLYSLRDKEKFLENTDIISSVLPLGQAIGRWGNFFNFELLGRQTHLPWALNGKHPLFIYESLLDLALFLILIKQTRSKRNPGFITGIYLFGYGTIRFFLEYLRVNPWKVGNLNVAQLLSILSVVIAFFLIRKESPNDIYCIRSRRVRAKKTVEKIS